MDKETKKTKLKINDDPSFPYKYKKICIICGRIYGLDEIPVKDNDRCPICYFNSKSRWKNKK